MKKLVCSVLLCLSLSTFGQIKKKSIGFKIGVNISTVVGENLLDEVESKGGLNLGVLYEIPFTEKFSIQPEVNYSSQGGKLVLDGFINSFGSEPNYHQVSKNYLKYINIPVMLKYCMNEAFSLCLGPQLGILISAKNETEDTYSSFGEEPSVTKETFEKDVKGLYNDIDFGLNFGLGYEFKKHYLLDARYNLGLTSINALGNGSIRNSVFQISAGYRF